MVTKSSNNFPNKCTTAKQQAMLMIKFDSLKLLGQIVLFLMVIKMCTTLLILKFIHNFKILVTLTGESANNFTKFRETSNKESFVEIAQMWRKFTQL